MGIRSEYSRFAFEPSILKKMPRSNDYNKYELVQWSLENDHPIMYELEEGKESLLALYTTKQIWNSVWINKYYVNIFICNL